MARTTYRSVDQVLAEEIREAHAANAALQLELEEERRDREARRIARRLERRRAETDRRALEAQTARYQLRRSFERSWSHGE